MEYLQGRKFEDVRMPEIETKEEREQLSVFTLSLALLPFTSHFQNPDGNRHNVGGSQSSRL